MVSIRTTIAGCAAALALTACQPTVQQLSADEVRSTFVGMTSYGTVGDGKNFVAYLAPDGTIKARDGDKQDAGRYRIDPNGELCIHYQDQQQPEDVCQTLWRGNGKYYSTLDGARPGAIITTVRPGNADNL